MLIEIVGKGLKSNLQDPKVLLTEKGADEKGW